MIKQLNNPMIYRLAFLLLVLFSFTACNKTEKIHTKNIEEIEQYLTDNNLTAQKTESGLHYIITVEGNGNFPTVQDDVKVNYTGYLTNKTIFDQGLNITFPLANVIQGWQEGIPKISKGGSAILFIPSRIAYGSSAQGGIPANAVLIFEVDLLDF
jgi:FKBP-type peptidyl-prolyl cis-trans isomerase FkpA